MTKIKICGLRRAADARLLNRYGVDYAGFVFAESRRRISLREADTLKLMLEPSIQTVGVFVNAGLSFVKEIAATGVLDVIQLHGDEDENYLLTLRESVGLPLIRACRVRSAEDIVQADRSTAEYLLLDAYGEAYGGTGRGFSYDLIGATAHALFLAGGLRAENVRETIARVRLFAVDASSGLETDGYKDAAKVAAFVEAVRGIDEEGTNEA